MVGILLRRVAADFWAQTHSLLSQEVGHFPTLDVALLFDCFGLFVRAVCYTYVSRAPDRLLLILEVMRRYARNLLGNCKGRQMGRSRTPEISWEHQRTALRPV